MWHIVTKVIGFYDVVVILNFELLKKWKYSIFSMFSIAIHGDYIKIKIKDN
jgi:hypothetical protein